MARQRVHRQQNDVAQQHQRTHAHPELPVEKERLNGVFPQKKQKQYRQVKEVPMYILQNKRKPGLALVIPLPLTHRATWRIEEKRTIVGFAAVVAGGAKTQRPAQNQQRRRKFPPTMMLIHHRGIQRREIPSPFIKSS